MSFRSRRGGGAELCVLDLIFGDPEKSGWA